MSAEKLHTEIIRDWSCFYRLETQWNELLSGSRSDSIFLTWQWVRSWIETVEERVRPFVIAVRDSQGNLVGAAPFYFANVRFLNLISYRTLNIIGDYASGAEYPDWIVREDDRLPATRAIYRALNGNRRLWDCIWMPNMAGWTGSVENIAWACRKAAFRCHIRTRNFSAIALPEKLGVFLESFSPAKRRQLLRLSRKILNRDGVFVSRCDDSNSLPAYLEALFELHRKRWNDKGQNGAFVKRPLSTIFYRNFAKKALENGWLKIYAVVDDGEIKAIQLGYVYKGAFHQLQEGFDPQYFSGVGNVLRLKVVEDCIRNGIGKYDFLGGFSEHKRRWLAVRRTGFDIFIGNPNPKTRLLFAQKIWPGGRFLRPAALSDFPLPENSLPNAGRKSCELVST